MKKGFRIFIIVIICFFILSSISVVAYYVFRPQSIPVLAYHEFKLKKEMSVEDKNNYFIVAVEEFEKQMKYIKENNYKTLTMEEFYCWMKRKCELPKKSVLITFDDGYASIYNYILPILKKYQIKATSFVIASRIKSENEVDKNYAYLTKEMIEKAHLEYDGLEFHSHSYDLHKTTQEGKAYVNVVDKETLRNDVIMSSNILKSSIFAYPFGEYNNDIIDVLKEEYIMAFTYKSPFYRATQNDNIYTIPRVSIGGNLPFFRFKIALDYGLISKKNILPK